MRGPLLITLGFVSCMTLASFLDPQFQTDKSAQGPQESGILALAFGDSRQLLANHLFTKADAYFHDGNYPSVFDAPLKEESHMTERGNANSEHSDEHAEDQDDHDGHHDHDAASPPSDWIERFGQRFTLNQHKHLEGQNTREMLPWLQMAAQMDPHRPIFYVTASYWLRRRLHKPQEAEQFLRDGLRANPNSYEILAELGQVRFEKNEITAAHQLWLLALKKWDEQNAQQLKPDELEGMEILGKLAKLEESQGEYDQAIAHFQLLKALSPQPEAVQRLIDQIIAKKNATAR
jgi:tetratricopeptide (TPR) repeat protein